MLCWKEPSLKNGEAPPKKSNQGLSLVRTAFRIGQTLPEKQV